MVDTQEISNLISQSLVAFGMDAETITIGSFENLPKPSDFSAYTDGKRFAIIKIPGIVPEFPHIKDVWKPVYQYEIYLIQKGRTGQIETIRDQLCGYVGYFLAELQKRKSYINVITLINRQFDEFEKDYDGICVVITGTISKLTRMSGQIND